MDPMVGTMTAVQNGSPPTTVAKVGKVTAAVPPSFQVVRGLSEVQQVEVLALLRTMENVHAFGSGCKEIGRVLMAALPHPDLSLTNRGMGHMAMEADEPCTVEGFWAISCTPGEFRKDGTDVHTVPGVPFSVLTIKPGRGMVYPGHGRAGMPSTLIGVYIHPGADCYPAGNE